MIFPRQDVPIYEKRFEDGRLRPEFAKMHLDYGEELLNSFKSRRVTMDRQYDSYYGITKPGSLAWLERNYGKQNKSKFVHYHLGRTKMNLLVGDFLKRPLAGTVVTTDSQSVSEKMRQIDLMRGAMLAKKEIEDIKNIAGIDVLDGIKIPSNEEEFEKMSPKDKEEMIMQIILNDSIKELGLKQKLSQSFLDLLITAMLYFRINIDEEGNVTVDRIDPREAIYESVDGDNFLERSPIRGCRLWIPVHEVLRRYRLSKEQRDQLDAARVNPKDFVTNSRGWAKMENGQLLVSVMHIEWISVEADYYEKSPKTKIQMDIDPGTAFVTREIYPEKTKEEYNKFQESISADKNRYVIKYNEFWYEATRIGGLIDVDCRKKFFQPRDWDKPSKVMASSYHGYIHDTSDALKLSMQDVVSKFEDLFNILMYQRNRTIAQAKGKVLFYDRAGMPKDRDMKTVMHQALNDGYVDYNSAASGNFGQKNIDITQAIKEIDLGLSASFDYTTKAIDQVTYALDKITGINENREGNIAASSTASNANSSIQASRTITEPLYYGMNGFVEKVMKSIVDFESISWAFYKIEKGEHILGTEKFKYLQISKKLGHKNYGVHIEDGGKYAEMKMLMKEAMMVSLNAKEIRPIDFFRASISETLAEAKNIYMQSWNEMMEARNKADQERNRVALEMKQQELQNRVQLSREDREDRQAADLANIQEKGKVQVVVDNNKAKNKMYENFQSAENSLLESE